MASNSIMKKPPVIRQEKNNISFAKNAFNTLQLID